MRESGTMINEAQQMLNKHLHQTFKINQPNGQN